MYFICTEETFVTQVLAQQHDFPRLSVTAPTSWDALPQQSLEHAAGRRQTLDNLPTRRDDLNNSRRNARERAMDAAAHDLSLEDGLSDEGFGMDEGEPPPPYMPTLPQGMETSAGKPQASSSLFIFVPRAWPDSAKKSNNAAHDSGILS